jgi:hypothetical protein
MSLGMKLATVLAALSCSVSAFAQADVVREADRVIYRKKTLIDFSDVIQDGERAAPSEAYGLGKQKARFENMIKVRRSFAPELRDSKDAL